MCRVRTVDCPCDARAPWLDWRMLGAGGGSAVLALDLVPLDDLAAGSNEGVGKTNTAESMPSA